MGRGISPASGNWETNQNAAKILYTPSSNQMVKVRVIYAANANLNNNRIEDDLRSRLAYAQAELALVRADVSKLNSGVYTPSPGAVEDALWPDPHRIQAVVADAQEVK